ncbi:MAG: response regulator [Phycisphaerales bacterium]|nr:response regulator [Phycisphaerales bacterium]|tara:strand:+ start:2261 stop:2803 length:543 start_codon:yes stop_codon:yes gene_type:complete
MSNAASTNPLPDLASATILIVDDNQQNLELMQAYLEDLGCRILTATDGDEAIEIVESSAPDLLLLDVMMPRVSGFQVCEKLKSQPSTRDIIVIMVTALNEVGDYERAVECGTNDFIAKPVNKHELITRVRSLLELGLLKRQFDQLPLGDRDAVTDRGLLDEGDSMLPPPDEELDSQTSNP